MVVLALFELLSLDDGAMVVLALLELLSPTCSIPPRGVWIQKKEMVAAMLRLQSEALAWKWTLHLAAASCSQARVERAWQHWQLGLDGATPLHIGLG